MNYETIIQLKVKRIVGTAIAVLVLAGVSVSCSTSETQTVANFETLVMQDNFDRRVATDSTPNARFWNYDIGTGGNGWGNNELEYYTDRPENVHVTTNGTLKIIANKESFQGANYTSARLKTQNKFSQAYGRFEARIKMPWGQGLWPAFWLLGDDIETVGWPNCGEIDIMEYRGQEPTIMHGTVHGPNYSAVNGIGKAYDLVNDRFDTGFHIFGIEWTREHINFYVDDVLYNQITPEDVTGEWVFNKPFFIIMNVAVGGNYVGSPNENTVFPQTMEVDYVRVYSADQ